LKHVPDRFQVLAIDAVSRNNPSVARPRVSGQFLQRWDDARADRVEVYISDEFAIMIFTGKSFGFITILEKVSNTVMAPVEIQTVAGQ
jgi:hypothetical protein